MLVARGYGRGPGRARAAADGKILNDFKAHASERGAATATIGRDRRALRAGPAATKRIAHGDALSSGVRTPENLRYAPWRARKAAR